MRFSLSDVEPSPDVFAVVMATGILSVSADDHRYIVISDVLAAVGIVALAVMSVMVFARGVARRHFPFEVTDPEVMVRLFTFVAACAVLGARFGAHPVTIWLAAAVGWLAWLLLVPLTVRSMGPHRWAGLRDRADGAWELVSVATSGLAIVMVQLALLRGEKTLFGIGVATWVVGIGLYGLMTLLILWRAAAAPADEIWRPHSWILMGGLAIATLAGERLHHVALSVVTQDWLLDAVRFVTVVTWVVATMWIPPLVYVTVRRLRPTFAGVWWAMVFPLGMYSTASFAMKIETGWRPLEIVSLVFFWLGVAAWALVGLGAIVTFWRACRCQHAHTAGTREA